MSKSRFFGNDRESRFSLIFKQRFENTSSRPIMTEEHSKVERHDQVVNKKFVVLIKETNDFDEINTSKEGSVWRNKRPRNRTVSFAVDRLLTRLYEYFRVTGSQRFCRKLRQLIHCQSTKWWYSGIRFKLGRNFIVYDENPIWWHLGRIVQTETWIFTEANLGSSWNSYEKSQWDGRIEAISRFYLLHHCKTKISRGSGYYSGTLPVRFRNCRMKLILWMIREIFRMLNQYAVDNPTLQNNLRFCPLFQDLGGLLRRSLGMPSGSNRSPSNWDTHGTSGSVFFFVNRTASSSAHHPQGFNPWISSVSELTSPHVMSESQTPNTALDPRCHSGPSARNSFGLSEGRFSKNYGADQQRLQIP